MWGSNKSIGLACHEWFSFDNFDSNEINKFEVTILSDHKVLRFEIAINNSLTEEILEDKNHDRNIKLCVLCRQNTNLSDCWIEFLSLDKFY